MSTTGYVSIPLGSVGKNILGLICLSVFRSQSSSSCEDYLNRSQSSMLSHNRTSIIFDIERDHNAKLSLPGHQISLKDRPSDILLSHYGTLSQHLHHPINVAQLLYEEKIISKTMLSQILDSGQSESRRTILLSAICGAVHKNPHNLAIFVSVLKRFTENVPVANAIFNDYG